MPKRKAKHGGRGRKHAELADKALARRERRAGLYVSPGDPDFKSLSEQLEVHGLALRDVPGDGCVAWDSQSTVITKSLFLHGTSQVVIKLKMNF